MSVDSVESALASLGSSGLTDANKARLEAFPDLSRFAREFARLGEAERSKSFFTPEHGKLTAGNKEYFHYSEAQLASDLLGDAFAPDLPPIAPAGPFGAYDADRVAAAKQALDQDGYVIWPERLSTGFLDRLVQLLGEVPFFERTTGAPVDGYDAATATQHGSNAIDVVSQMDLIRLPEFQQLMFDPSAVDLAQKYLGCAPIHTQTAVWWTIGASLDEKELSRAALLFHQDKDYVKFLKCFIYLTDVEEVNGPHVYVRGSHRDYRDVHADARFSRRFSDDEIRASFGADRVAPITGPKGAIAFVDTSGYHKGAPVIEGHRLILQLEWACSLYLTGRQPFVSSVLGPDALALRERAPRMFAKYDDDAFERWDALNAQSAKKSKFLTRIGRSIRKRLPV